jgi:hypothetical protein
LTPTISVTTTITTTKLAPPLVVDTDPDEGASLKTGPTELSVSFNKDVVHDGSAVAADNQSNYMLIEPGINRNFDTVSCAGGRLDDDVRYYFTSVSYSNNGGAGPFKSLLTLPTPLPVGMYRLLICGTTSIQDFAGSKINGGFDSIVNFSVSSGHAKKLPSTGFVPGQFTIPQPQPLESAYLSTILF